MNQNASVPGLLSRLPGTPRKVALLRASRIGDFLCAAPALRALRKALPTAEICMITLPLLKDLAESSPYLDRFIPFPGYPGLAEQFFDARHTVQFFQAMQEEQFDLAIQMQGSGVNSNPFMLMLGARATAGFIRQDDTADLLDAALPFPEEEHEIRRVLALTTFLGAPAQGEELIFPLKEKDLVQARMMLKDTTPPLIGLHPSARDLARRWAPERFAAAGNLLQQYYGGTIVIVGDNEGQDLGDIVEQKLEGPYINLIGQTPLLLLGCIIKHLSVLLTNDTGPAHIAYALGTPTVTIFGASRPQINGPLHPGPFRVVLHEASHSSRDDRYCPGGDLGLRHVTVQQVVKATRDVMRA